MPKIPFGPGIAENGLTSLAIWSLTMGLTTELKNFFILFQDQIFAGLSTSKYDRILRNLVYAIKHIFLRVFLSSFVRICVF